MARRLTLIGLRCGQNGAVFLLHLLNVCLDFVNHFPNFFHLVEKLVHEAIATFHVNCHLVGSDIVLVALRLI